MTSEIDPVCVAPRRPLPAFQCGRAPGPMRRTVQLGSPPASNIRSAVLSDRRETQSSIASSPPLRVPPTHHALELFVSQLLVGTASHRRRPPQRRINIALLPLRHGSPISRLLILGGFHGATRPFRDARFPNCGGSCSPPARPSAHHARARRLVPSTKRTAAAVAFRPPCTTSTVYYDQRIVARAGPWCRMYRTTPADAHAALAPAQQPPSPQGVLGAIARRAAGVQYGHWAASPPRCEIGQKTKPGLF